MIDESMPPDKKCPQRHLALQPFLHGRGHQLAQLGGIVGRRRMNLRVKSGAQ